MVAQVHRPWWAHVEVAGTEDVMTEVGDLAVVRATLFADRLMSSP